MEFKEALQELRKAEKRNFKQSVDLLISLKGMDMRRDNVSTIATIPHPFKEKKVCGFLTRKTELVRTVLQPDFIRYKDKKELKTLLKSYDFFIAAMPLMPSVATTFGKILGPTGKMPTPQLGVMQKDDDAAIKQLLEKIDHAVKIRIKEPALKVSVGNEGMSDEQIYENALAIYNALIAVLPVKKDNVRSVMIKLTMGKPLKVELK